MNIDYKLYTFIKVSLVTIILLASNDVVNDFDIGVFSKLVYGNVCMLSRKIKIFVAITGYLKKRKLFL